MGCVLGVSSPRQACHCQRRVASLLWVFVLLQAQTRCKGLEALYCCPQALADPAVLRKLLDQLESHMEMFPALGAKVCRRMGRGEEEDRDGRGQEVVVKDLDAAVYLAGGVEQAQILDSLFGQADDQLSVVVILRDARGSMQNWCV